MCKTGRRSIWIWGNTGPRPNGKGLQWPDTKQAGLQNSMCSLSASFYIVCFSRFREGSRRQVVVEALNCMWRSSLALFALFLSAYRIWHSWCVQSILRQANFKGAKLLGASFFDSDLTGHHHHPAHVKTSWRQIFYKWLEPWTGVCTLARIWNLVPWDGCFFLQETIFSWC